jgi:superfamily II DNA or RNA helicase
MIEKRINDQLLETGELTLTDRECAALTLPEHSTTITIELEGETFGAQWSGRGRHLSGDMLAERLQDYGQDGGLLRLRLVDDVYRLVLLPPSATAQITTIVPPPPLIKRGGPRTARRRATVDRQFHSDNEYDWGSRSEPTVGFLSEARRLLGEQLKAAGFDPLELIELRLQGEELATLDDFEELLAVDVANVDRMPHQEAVARHALSRLRGRAVLADEVGLGKTIEAGLAVKELALRGLAKRVLILCPAPLRDQWREEMSHKFDLNFDVAYRGYDVKKQDKLILSLTLGRSVAETLTKKPWDIVIVDEAHRAAGAGARKTRELITSLTTACRYAFFLTATPVQNDLLELYRLVELLRPGTFTSVNAFKRQYMRSYDPRTPNDPAGLRRLISSVMIRTTRAQAGVDRVVRRAVDVSIDLGPREQELYALSTDLLRNIMVSPGDTMRRRSLALRLTASPFSMGTTALRMADRHPDERVRAALREMGHLAMDIQGSARENAAIELTRKWLREHGRVLIFTQHTDTVTGLLRRMAAEGLTARSFHGSMSASERAATIAAFRSGDAPIMISTDAGAEGQNLQFCNCVINYDLPWNPMRIEQRIGRVDRLTQPRDEVFVANLYARGTIDESVYRLLAEKLKMFELLFGQVTTILGELDESKSATFESRVLEALFANNDSKMTGLLAQLGTELTQARERASTLIAADTGLSNWMAAAFEHRKGLTKAGSTDLAPEVSERARMRQRRVQTWVRNVFKALGAELLHDTGEGDGAFLTAQFDEEFEQELGGRTIVHLAFDRLGMEHHPDAELCAVGSPVFDELLALLRMRGDMYATVPVIPEDIGPSPYRHAGTTTLVRRRLVPSGSWSGHATFRAAIGEAETTEHLITADINGHNKPRLPRRPLQDGETLPAAFDTASDVIGKFEKAAVGRLESLRRERAKQVETEQAREFDRIKGGYMAQIDEASYDDKARLRRALSSEERRLSRRPDIRARAKLLALTLDEDDWLIEETWAGPGGVEGSLTYEWGLSEVPQVDSDATGTPIRVLALCSGAHWVDESERQHCASCERDWCAACGEVAVFADCPVCGVSSCGSCRDETGGLCLRCASPERAPDLDEQFAIAWRLNAGASLLVGERVAKLTRRGQQDAALVVLDADVNDRDRVRMRSYAAQHNLPADCGLILRDLTAHPTAPETTRARLNSNTTVNVELSTSDDLTSAIDPAAAEDVPDHPTVEVISESAGTLVELLSRLRVEFPPPTPPAVMVTRRSTFADVYLEADGLVEEISVVADDGALATLNVSSAPLQWRDPSVGDDMLASAEIGGLRVSLQHRNDAVLVTALADSPSSDERWIALPDGCSAADQLAWFDKLCALDMPSGRIGKRTNEIQAMHGAYPVPTDCELAERTIRPVAELVRFESDFDLVPADATSLAALNVRRDAAPRIPSVPAQLGQTLLERARRSFTHAVCKGFEVTETWRGHGTAVHKYQTFDGEPFMPTLDDVGFPESDFGVCRDGHFYAAHTAALCAACETWSCRACDDGSHQASVPCPSCSARVCRRCVSTDHVVPSRQCRLCTDHACSECGRDPEVQACPICEREMCSSCRVDELCPACSWLTPATSEQLTHLPGALATTGATVLIGSDADAMTVLINRGNALERAVLRNGSADSWIAYGRNEIDDSYRLRVTASNSLDAQVVPAVESLDPEPPMDSPHLVAHSVRRFYPTWSVAELDVSGGGATSFADPDRDLRSVVLGDFPAHPVLPIAAPVTPSQVKRAFASTEQPSTANLLLRWHRVGRDLTITTAGICERTIKESTVKESDASWTETNAVPAWVSDEWAPTPSARLYVECEDAEAVVVAMASLLALGVRTHDRTEWYTITASEKAPGATALGRWVGVGDVDEVNAFTDPKAVRLSAISNATDHSVNVKPLGRVKTDPTRQEDITFDALKAWMPTAAIATPELRTLPQELRHLLEWRVRPAAPRAKLEIGAHVEELVKVEGGHVWRRETTLLPTQTDARRIDTNGRTHLDVGAIDREGHFGSEGALCAYCSGRVCAVCVNGLVTCDCCDALLCKRCVHKPHNDLWLCPACATMRRPERREARDHGRLLSTRRMLIGSDPLHVVVVEQAKSRWHRHGPDGAKHAIASPAVSHFLDELLAGGGTDALKD